MKNNMMIAQLIDSLANEIVLNNNIANRTKNKRIKNKCEKKIKELKILLNIWNH